MQSSDDIRRFRDLLTVFNEACRRMSWRFPAGSTGLAEHSKVPPGWVAFDSFASDAVIDATLARRGGVSVFTSQWTLSNVLTMPLLFAGFSYGTVKQVPLLSGSILLDSRNYLQNMLVTGPGFLDTGDSPQALRDEVMTVCAPIVAAFQRRTLISRPNAWASVLDSLNQGLVLAGWATGRLDAVWQIWDTLVGDWDVPTRRRPRRLQYEYQRMRDEIAVRASCCLNFTATPGAAITYCATCPVSIPNEERIQRTIEWMRRISGH